MWTGMSETLPFLQWGIDRAKRAASINSSKTVIILIDIIFRAKILGPVLVVVDAFAWHEETTPALLRRDSWYQE